MRFGQTIKHRLFSYISQPWRGLPLIGHEVIVQLMGSNHHADGAVRPGSAQSWPVSHQEARVRGSPRNRATPSPRVP